MFRKFISKFFASTAEIDVADDKNRFNVIFQKMLNTRWYITIITLLTFLFIIIGIVLCIVFKVELMAAWKDILLVMLGAFIGSYNRVIDHWFNNSQRDEKILEKMDQENDSEEVLKRKLTIQAKSDGKIPPPVVMVAEAAPEADKAPKESKAKKDVAP